MEELDEDDGLPQLSPIEGFVVSIFRRNRTMQWAWQAEPSKAPVFLCKSDFETPPTYIDLRDFPDLFESLPNNVYQATAAARNLYYSLPRPF